MQGILLMYDITSMTSYQTLMKWLQTVNEVRDSDTHCVTSLISSPPLPPPSLLPQVGLEGVTMVVVGNKVDLEDRREVPLETATKVSLTHSHCTPCM